MTRKLATIQQKVSIGEAARIMSEKNFSGPLVLDDENDLVGIIAEPDIFRLVVNEWHRD